MTSIPRFEPPGTGGEHVPNGAMGPGMRALLNHLLSHYPGSKSLGVYNNRSVRGGHSTSLHAVSRAVDWSYGNNRSQAEDVMKALTDNDGALATILGVQAIHDYHTRKNNGSPWSRVPARSWGHNKAYWHWSNVGPGDTWLHISLTREAAADPKLMERVLRIGDVTSDIPVHPHVGIDEHLDHPEETTMPEFLVRDPHFGAHNGGTFLPDGTPVSGEMLDFYEHHHVPIVVQNHAEWRAAARHKMGADAAHHYDH